MKYTTLVLAACTAVGLHGQEQPADPYKDGEGGQPVLEADAAPRNISICYETFSMPLAVAASIQREQLADSALYARILEALKKDEVRQESFSVLRSSPGLKATTESVSEQIYPTEFDPPELPSVVGVQVAPVPKPEAPRVTPNTSELKNAPALESLDGIRTPATPTAYETRMTGITFEMESTLSEDGTMIDLMARPEHVTLVGHTISGQGLSSAKMPVFEKQSLQVYATVRINQPYFVGTVSRPPNSEVDPDSANQVWFAFMTATLSKP